MKPKSPKSLEAFVAGISTRRGICAVCALPEVKEINEARKNLRIGAVRVQDWLIKERRNPKPPSRNMIDRHFREHLNEQI